VCRVENADNVRVQYLDHNRIKQETHASWLVGADGKRGVVRKNFLEPSAGIRQEKGIFEYDGIWIAGNLKITFPTPESHPDLPFWQNGQDPQAVYDLFWPPEWHFCRPPGRPVACGRIGSASEYLWRHELAVPEWEDSMDANELFWENLTPMITRTVMTKSNGPMQVTFPRDCIEVLRCRPFRFNHRVVNKWFDNRTVLIGDAAHVFPPFGGQGVASGIQDAENLAWRLALLIRTNCSSAFQNSILHSWAAERRLGIDISAKFTLMNGELCNNKPTLKMRILVPIMNIALSLSSMLGRPSLEAHAVAHGYKACADGTFLAEFDGGSKLAQIYLQTRSGYSKSAKIELSDFVLSRVPTIFTLLVIHPPIPSDDAHDQELDSIIDEYEIPTDLLSKESIVCFNSLTSPGIKQSIGQRPVSFPASRDLLTGYPSRPLYDANQFMRHLGNSEVNYVIIRPDQFIYAKARTLEELRRCFEMLKTKFS
jgi:2-polyprenyl-6-methoxyphenol hydroxylase-like FAD-dependent oxidoreductase